MIKERKNDCQGWIKELHRILCMQGGDDDVSYARNSEGPAMALRLSRPLITEGIRSMELFKGEDSLRIADLGCATGYNTLAAMDCVVDTLRSRYHQDFGYQPEIQAFFSDLPSNDFNSLFRLLPPMILSHNDNDDDHYAEETRDYYAAGVPGSFYYRLFPKGKLHVVLNTGDGVGQGFTGIQQGRAWIEGARKEVLEAYARQSEEDLKAFLQCRKEEMVKGGLLFILMAGRSHPQREDQLGDPDTRAKHPFTSSMDQAWQDLLDEGLIDEETRDKFNIPAYMRSTDEVMEAFNQCNGFDVKKLEFKRIEEHTEEKQQEWISDPVSYGRTKANLVRATLKPIVQAHVGRMLSEELFKRFEKIVSGDEEMLHKTCFYGVIVVRAVRK
ncbi:Gibberellic acid methyltransferase 2 [Acorus calamus]|uniref:Gibberellic acid methyltransferase 2 n=1 Tax=Acorus calamus TaxID=4465 RepID=A0AAV9CWY6_ACOCL|nr:Gibberellic acid methyltransferase 2 [Acorus calamus]